MTQEQFEEIMRKIRILEDAARFECGCYIRECISDVAEAVIKAKESEE